MVIARTELEAGSSLIGSSSNGIAAGASAAMISPARPKRVITTRPQLPISDQELRARIVWATMTSPHFQLAYDQSAFAVPRAKLILETLESAYSLIFHFTHESFADRFQVHAVDQRSSELLGRAVRPHFNFAERAIYLVETSSQNIYAELIEQLTHAMRIVRYAKHYDHTPGWATMEEGFSVFLNERLSISPAVYPFYGADADVIAYHIYKDHPSKIVDLWAIPSIPLTVTQRVLAGAFFLHLGNIYSDDQIATFSKSDYPITSETFQAFFGARLEELEDAWVTHLPSALIALTHEEMDVMLQKWERTIEGRYH